jgi:peptide chain release factor 3
LSEEGAAQVFYAESETGPAPIVGAVGQLQFDVMLFRLTNEYGAPCRFEPIGYRFPRWVTGPQAAIDRAGNARGRLRLYDTKGAPLLLFENEWSLRWALENEKELTFHDVAP